MLGVSIKECMTTKVIGIDGETSIRELAKTMRDHGISCVVVQRNGEPCGIVTEKDLVKKCIIEGIDANSSSFKIMSSPLITVDGDVALTKASKLMENMGSGGLS